MPDQPHLRVAYGELANLPNSELERMEAIMRERGLVLVPQRMTDQEMQQLRAHYPRAVVRRNQDLAADTLVCIRRHVAVRNLWLSEDE